MKNLMNLERPITYATLSLLIVLLIDFVTPLGVAVGVLYVFCLFLVCRQKIKVIITFAVIISLLIFAKFLAFHSPTTSSFAVYNRLITLFVITIITLVAIQHRKLADTISEERKIYIKELEQMLFMTSHKIRKPVTSCLGLMQLLETNQPMTVEELQKTVSYFKTSAMELDEFTKELTIFIQDIKTQDEIRQVKQCA